MSFEQQLQQYPQQEIHELVRNATPQRIEQALHRPRLSMEDFAALLSPQLTDDQLEAMANRAHKITKQRFGRTILLYAPLYLSNECHNGCKYCGFSADNHLPRKTLSLDEVEREAKLLRDQGFRHMLLLTGEAPEAAGIDYLETAIKTMKHHCGSVSIEVFPMDTNGYKRMVDAGVDGLTLYQETYDPDLYRQLHPYGPKSDYSYRLAAPERAGEAGMRRIGVGALLGLGDCLTDVFYTGLHALYLARKFWRTQVTISFPRMRPAEGGYQPNSIVSDRQLTQFICALRLLIPDAGLILSTRESSELRDNLLPLGITQMSAGSCTAPGGYGDDDHESEQFAISDERSPAEMEALLRARGYDPVWKDWDSAFLNEAS
ncbi:tyrosine lyase ThiH [Malonomonas rubra DSM 5091]|uniref:Tyrosine lyase ThiH n=1 Tax=Malonomonas rubra DSM 5091 TaxID=1122189 RepID=A0A1M6BEN0_MALRU|nr:2-iminoacetate synthase ThiH [Malonomonas rubra]SHI47210.1 tyrosine lyase ThiH [Malonomonas rubra DSM 5091]